MIKYNKNVVVDPNVSQKHRKYLDQKYSLYSCISVYMEWILRNIFEFLMFRYIFYGLDILDIFLDMISIYFYYNYSNYLSLALDNSKVYKSKFHEN